MVVYKTKLNLVTIFQPFHISVIANQYIREFGHNQGDCFRAYNFIKKEAQEQLFFYELYQIFKNFFFIEHIRGTTSYLESFLLECWRHFHKYIYTGAAIFWAPRVTITSNCHKTMFCLNITYNKYFFQKLFEIINIRILLCIFFKLK